MPAGAPTPTGLLDAALIDLHGVRDIRQIDAVLQRHLGRLLPEQDAALLLMDAKPDRATVRMCLDPDGAWQPGRSCEVDELRRTAGTALDITYDGRNLGVLLVEGTVLEDSPVHTLLEHYGIALVNLTLEEEARSATDSYCASLQALEEGIVLFQETDQEAVTARLMGLATHMLHATAGALFVLEEVGNPASELVLTQTLGIPEDLLLSFRGSRGVDWPRCLLDREPFFVRRDEDPSLGGLDERSLPAILADLACLPLRYHGVTAGVCLLFNTSERSVDARERLRRMNSLGELAAALLHRLSLEAIQVRNREIETQLEIAEVIQNRLLPEAAPQCAELDFAWCSRAARKIGGDYLDLFADERGRVHALIADASGHGVDSALLMTSFRSTYRAEAPRHEPADLLLRLNRNVRHEVGATGMFLTAATLRIDPETLRADFAGAGHNPVLWYRAETGNFEELESQGPPLGFLSEVRFEDRTIELRSGDLLVLYTDGITEATRTDGAMFGEERLRTAIRSRAAAGAQAVLDGVLADLEAYTGRESHEDDVSITVVTVR